MNDLSCWIQGLNEEKQLPRVFAPLKDIKDIVFVDHQSSDNSVEVAKSLGARVYVREFVHDIATEEDVAEFKKRFKYDPLFKAGDKILDSGRERSEIQKLCKNDWCLNLDCDEIITWDYNKVIPLLKDSDVIGCKFYHYRTPDGKRTDWFQTTKLYNRAKTFWIGRAHEVLNGYDLKVGWSEEMEIDHYQIVKDNRNGYIAILEYSVLKDQDSRSFYYLGKEYHHKKDYEKSIKIMSLYLKEAFILAERVKAYLFIADSMWELGREDEAFVYATQALKLNPASQEAYLFIAKIAPKRDQAVWLKHAGIAENDHLV